MSDCMHTSTIIIIYRIHKTESTAPEEKKNKEDEDRTYDRLL